MRGKRSARKARPVIELDVLGIGLWADGLPGWTRARPVLRGEAPASPVAPADSAARLPGSRLLPPAERRRAPVTVSLALAVAEEACANAGLAPDQLPSVFSSTHGDLEITDYLCRVLATAPANLSPTRFHNSVHNAPSGYWSIGTGSMLPSTALSAWHQSFAAGLLEAATQAMCEATPVLVVAYDMPARGPLAAMARSEGLFGAALVLAPASASASAAASASGAARRLDLSLGAPQAPFEAGAEQGEHCPVNPMARGLPLLRALARDPAARVEFALSPTLSIHVAVHAASSDAPASPQTASDDHHPA
jgi:Beta-ketoacyl synthase, N-terminal domain